jgi:catechol-2,3-dioxygenase
MLPNLYIDHLVYRVPDLIATDKFYSAIFGEPTFRNEDALMYQAGDTMLFFTTSPRNPSDPYDKEQPGLNHVAFGVREPSHLREIQDHLNNSSVTHSSIRIDSHGKKEYIWLDDLNGFRVEFYCRPATST